MKFDTPEWREARDKLLLDWTKGDVAAADYLVIIFHVAEIWDDLIDRDKPVTDEQINDLFITLLFDLTGNPFFVQHAGFLRPAMLLGINAWLDSVQYEREGLPELLIRAHILRAWYMELVPLVAFLVGGYEHMRAVSSEARAFFQTEKLSQYLEDFTGGSV